jgi:hypothetical protein
MWASSNSSVATVNNSGQVTARGVGDTNINIQLSDGTVMATARVNVHTITMDMLDGNIYFIQLKNSELFLNIHNDRTENGERVWLEEHNKSVAQQWRFERQSNGAYKIISLHSGRLMEVRNSGLENGAQVAQWDDANIPTQQ